MTGAPLAIRNRARGLGRRVRGRRRPLARDARRLRPPRLLPPGLRLRLARRRARRPRTRRSAARDDAIGSLLEAAGGPDEFLERYAVAPLLGPRPDARRERVRLEDSFSGFRLFQPGTDARRARGHRFQPRGDGLPPPRLHARDARSSPSVWTGSPRRRRPLPRGRTGRRPAGRGGASLRPVPRLGDERRRDVLDAPERARARLGRAREPERRRRARLGRAGLGVRRPRRPRITSAAAATARSRAATRTCRCSRSGSERRRRGSSTSRRACSTTSASAVTR